MIKTRKQDSLTEKEYQAHDDHTNLSFPVISKGGHENPGDGCATQSPAIKDGVCENGS